MGWCGDQVLGAENAVHRGFRDEVPFVVGVFDRQLARREVFKGLNNRIEGSHRQTRKREKLMGRFKSPGQAPRFLEAHDQINAIFPPHRYRMHAARYRETRSDALELWNDYALEMSA